MPSMRQTSEDSAQQAAEFAAALVLWQHYAMQMN